MTDIGEREKPPNPKELHSKNERLEYINSHISLGYFKKTRFSAIEKKKVENKHGREII